MNPDAAPPLAILCPLRRRRWQQKQLHFRFHVERAISLIWSAIPNNMTVEIVARLDGVRPQRTATAPQYRPTTQIAIDMSRAGATWLRSLMIRRGSVIARGKEALYATSPI